MNRTRLIGLRAMTAHASPTVEANKTLVRRFWDDLYAHDFAKVGTYFSDDAVYDDVPIPAAKAIGPTAIVRKLTIGLGRVPKHVHHLQQLVAEGDCVVTEHVEDWCFAPDHVVSLPFVSVHVKRIEPLHAARGSTASDTTAPSKNARRERRGAVNGPRIRAEGGSAGTRRGRASRCRRACRTSRGA